MNPKGRLSLSAIPETNRVMVDADFELADASAEFDLSEMSLWQRLKLARLAVFNGRFRWSHFTQRVQFSEEGEAADVPLMASGAGIEREREHAKGEEDAHG